MRRFLAQLGRRRGSRAVTPTPAPAAAAAQGRRRNGTGRRGGFTLIEAAIVTAIVGIGIVALLELMAAGSMANIESSQLTTAVFLANNIDEMMQGAPYSSLHSTYDNVTYSPPRDGRGASLGGFDNWQQVIDVSYVDPNLVTSPVPDSQVTPVSRVTVNIVYDNRVVYTARWLVAAPN